MHLSFVFRDGQIQFNGPPRRIISVNGIHTAADCALKKMDRWSRKDFRGCFGILTLCSVGARPDLLFFISSLLPVVIIQCVLTTSACIPFLDQCIPLKHARAQRAFVSLLRPLRVLKSSLWHFFPKRGSSITIISNN